MADMIGALLEVSILP